MIADFFKWAWSSATYWPLWLGVLATSFMIREIWALASGRSSDTLSYWVWIHLKITVHERIWQWSAADFLTFGIWIVLVTWLTFHFFLHEFT
jgi:hypothetical protein